MQHSARNFSGRLVRVEGKKVKVPEFSKWEQKISCCGCHLAYFPEINAYFCNQWECDWSYPALVLSVVIISAAFGIWSVIDLFKGTTQIALLCVFSIIILFWMISYFLSMCRSPGYLPWYWAVQKGTQYTYEEQMDGIITNQDQQEFAASFSKPERGSLTKKGRRLVLRADHICPWISNWVGLKNYRYFFIQLLYTVLLFAMWFVVFGFVIADIAMNGWKTNVTNISMIICFVPVVLFFIFFVIVFKRHIRYLCTNMTTLQELKMNSERDTENPYDLGCCNNCSETLGPKYCCPLWFIPIPLPRMNAGIFWHRNDEDEDSDDVAAEVPRRNVVFVNTEDQKQADSEDDDLAPIEVNYSSDDDLAPLEYNVNDQEDVANLYDLEEPIEPEPEDIEEVEEKQMPKNENVIKLVGIKTEEFLNDNITSTRTKEEHRKNRMRIYDPERDKGKKVYKKVKISKKLAEERKRLKEEGKDYHDVLTPKKSPQKKRRQSEKKEKRNERMQTPIASEENEKTVTFDSEAVKTDNAQSTFDRMPSIPSTIESRTTVTNNTEENTPKSKKSSKSPKSSKASKSSKAIKSPKTSKASKSSAVSRDSTATNESKSSTVDRMPSIPSTSDTNTEDFSLEAMRPKKSTHKRSARRDHNESSSDSDVKKPATKRKSKTSNVNRLPSIPSDY